MIPKGWIVAACALFIALFPCLALADGVYYPPVAFPAKPLIPSQRAMIVYRDGSETLIVESTFQSAAPQVGWIVPVPAAPTSIAKADPGLLETLDWCTGPQIVAGVHAPLRVGSTVLILASVITVIAVTNRRWIVAQVVGALAMAILFMGMLTPSFGDSTQPIAREQRGAELLRRQRVGNYDVQVLQAANADALSDWLTSNQLQPLGALDRGVFEKYIADGWCFVVASLDANGAASAAPHPLAIRFPVASPVFPMRATALAGSVTQVDLFVISDRRATAEGFQTIATDRFSPEAEAPPNWSPALPPADRAYVAAGTSVVIGHPGALEQMWKGCVLTHLSGSLSPGEMHEDVRIAFTDGSAFRQRVYSPRARMHIVAAAGVWGANLLVVSFMVIGWGRRKPKKGDRLYLSGVALVTVVGCAAAYWALPVVPVIESRKYVVLGEEANLRETAADLIAHKQLDASVFDDMRVFSRLLSMRRRDGAAWLNPYTGAPITARRAPGDFFAIRSDAGAFLCLYDRAGREWRLPLPPTESRQEASATAPSAR